MRFIVDSGSVVSLLPRKAVQRKLRRQALVLHAANASPIATYGRYSMELNLALRRALSWSFVVADVQTAILSADFLVYYGLLVDVKSKRILDPLTLLSLEGTLANPQVYSVSRVDWIDVPDGSLGSVYTKLIREFADLATPISVAATLPDSLVRYSIVTTGPPIVERPRRLTGDRLTAAKAEFAMLLDRGIIRPSSSQWASPLNLVPKKDGSLRATGDYRRLNACTIPDRYPLPVIEDLLQEVQGQVLTKVDLQRAFYQIPVAEEDIPKTAVTTPFGLFDFVGRPLGLRHSTQTLQRTIDYLLRKLPFVKCYLDDLFVASLSHKEHLDHLRQVLETLRAAKLKINLAKCAFGKPQSVCLGYFVSKDGFKPPQQKIEAIESYPRPEHSASLRRFLGMVNYYRRCIPRAADLQAPLHDLLKGIPKKGKLSWTTEADIALQRCKSCIAEATQFSSLPQLH